MADDYDDEPRRPKKRSKKSSGSGDSGNSTVKILLIVFGSLAGVAVISCCGSGVWLFYAAKGIAKRADLKAPADIQKLTAEMTDITVPAEFVPQHGSAIPIVGIKTVKYQWCPGGNCVARADGLGMLLLTSFNVKNGPNPGQNVPTLSEEEFSDDFLKAQWKDYTKTKHEFDIRGKKCEFFIVQGEQLDYDAMDESTMDDEAEEGVTVVTIDPLGESVPNTPATPNIPQGAGRKAVRVSGAFPGKEAEVTLELWLAPEQYDAARILEMLKSIR